jgi:hypothetical protein
MAQPPLIPSTWSSFPDEFRNRLGSTVGRQRCMHSDGHLLIVAHQLPERDEAARRGVLFWRDSGGEWRCSSGEPGKASLGLHLDRNAKRLDAHEQQASTAKHAEDFLPLLDGLAPIVRSNRNLLTTLEEARKLVPKVRELIDYRDRAYDLSRQAELLYEDVRNSLDVAVVRRADDGGRASFKRHGGVVLSLCNVKFNLWYHTDGELEVVPVRRAVCCPGSCVFDRRHCDDGLYHQEAKVALCHCVAAYVSLHTVSTD